MRTKKTFRNKEHIWYFDIDDIGVTICIFMDDTYTFSSSTGEAAAMMADFEEELEMLDLSVQETKFEYMKNRFVRDDVKLIIQTKEAKLVEGFEVLGSWVRIDMREHEAAKHRISRAWRVFHKWREVLVNRDVNIKERLMFWHKTVGRSMTWALETTRASAVIKRLLKSAQRQMVVKMLGLKRISEGWVIEPWLQYHIRMCTKAKTVLRSNDSEITKMLERDKIQFASHISRFAIGDRETHLVKHVLLWRPLKWWRLQQIHIKEGRDFLVHPEPGFKARWENQFGPSWVSKYSKQAIDEAEGIGRAVLEEWLRHM